MFTPFAVDGIGLHTGKQCRVTVAPLAADSGIHVITDGYDLPCQPESLSKEARFATCISQNGHSVTTIEHLLAALSATGEKDVRLDLEGPEIPILDGSAAPWYDALLSAGATPGFQYLEITTPIDTQSQEAFARVTPIRADQSPHIHVIVDFQQLPLPEREFVFFPEKDNFHKIAPARTFAFEKDIPPLLGAGFAKGGSMDNALIIGDHGPLNPKGQRFHNEPVRHKLLDVIGDLLLAGGLPRAATTLFRPGHHLNHQLARELISVVRG